MSEQALSTAESAPAPTIAATNWRTILIFADDDIDPSLFWQIENVADERLLMPQREASIDRRNLRLAHQKQVGIVRRQCLVQRRLDDVAGTRRLDDVRRHDDGEISLVLLVGRAAEQGAEYRQVADPGNLVF